MAFVTDKEQLKSGVIIFRRGDVDHRNWYCRIKLPRADRYKTISLKTSDKETARERALDHESEVRFKLKHNVAVFERPFSQVAEEYALLQDKRAEDGEITKRRANKVRSLIKAQLNPYVGSTQIHLIGQDRWTGYPAWRRKSGEGRMVRHGNTRPLTEEEAAAKKEKAEEMAAKAARVARGRRQPKAPKPPRDVWVMVSNDTIKFEMAAFRGIMNYAISKRYVSADHAFKKVIDLKTERRDEFTLNEYRALHSKGRAWVKKANPALSVSVWTRTVVYNFILIMCNTGMRPSEAKNLRWRDITNATDREGREIVVLWVRGKGKERKLVAPKSSVGEYLDRIRRITEEKRSHRPILPDDPVFTTYAGDPAKFLYDGLIEDLLTKAELLYGQQGTPRTAYCFRHTYATLRLSEGVDVYFLADQMGTSVQMIEKHYGHVNTIRHADRVLQGMGGWDPDEDQPADQPVEKTRAKKDAADRQAIKSKQPQQIGSPAWSGRSQSSVSKRSR